VDDNAVYRTTSLEVYLRACRAVYRALSRKVDQCVDRVDAADTQDRPREYNRWMNPERSRSRQSSQHLRSIEIRRLTHRPSVQIIYIVVHQV